MSFVNLKAFVANKNCLYIIGSFKHQTQVDP